jgi:hypothetical protein
VPADWCNLRLASQPIHRKHCRRPVRAHRTVELQLSTRRLAPTAHPTPVQQATLHTVEGSSTRMRMLPKTTTHRTTPVANHATHHTAGDWCGVSCVIERLAEGNPLTPVKQLPNTFHLLAETDTSPPKTTTIDSNRLQLLLDSDFQAGLLQCHSQDTNKNLVDEYSYIRDKSRWARALAGRGQPNKLSVPVYAHSRLEMQRDQRKQGAGRSNSLAAGQPSDNQRQHISAWTLAGGPPSFTPKWRLLSTRPVALKRQAEAIDSASGPAQPRFSRSEFPAQTVSATVKRAHKGFTAAVRELGAALSTESQLSLHLLATTRRMLNRATTLERTAPTGMRSKAAAAASPSDVDVPSVADNASAELSLPASTRPTACIERGHASQSADDMAPSTTSGTGDSDPAALASPPKRTRRATSARSAKLPRFATKR